jgi:hypothetical protein
MDRLQHGVTLIANSVTINELTILDYQLGPQTEYKRWKRILSTQLMSDVNTVHGRKRI